MTAPLRDWLGRVIGTAGTEVATDVELDAAEPTRSGALVPVMPGQRGLPILHPAPPTVTAGAVNAASAIAGGVLWDLSAREHTMILGASPVRGVTWPDVQGIRPSLTYTTGMSAPPFALEFVLDTDDATGRWELFWKGSNGTVRVLVLGADGRWQQVTAGATFSHPADGNSYRDLITHGAAGVHMVRLEFSGNAVPYGITTSPASSLRATSGRRSRALVVGDSFTEPTIVDAGTWMTWDGWAQQLAHLTGWDVWSAAKGNSGYLTGSPTFRARLAADVIPAAPDLILWAGGINDSGQSVSAVVAEAQACWAQVRAALPRCRQVVLAPFWRGGETTMSNVLVAMDRALQAAAVDAGLVYLPVFVGPAIAGHARTSTVATASATGQANLTVASANWLPSTTPHYVRVDGADPARAEVRRITNVTDLGETVRLTASSNWTYTHAVGVPVEVVGPPLMTGTGRQGTVAGNGNADRFTSSDGTHPTRAGHRNIADRVFVELGRQLR